MGAPKPGDAAAWAPRIAQGMDVLKSHAINGFKINLRCEFFKTLLVQFYTVNIKPQDDLIFAKRLAINSPGLIHIEIKCLVVLIRKSAQSLITT